MPHFVSNDYVPLPGSAKELLPDSRPAGPVNPAETDTVTVRIRGKNDSRSLEERVDDQADLRIADRTYLTREELAQEYGASKEDLDAVEQFAQTHDLVVVKRSAAERSLVLKGTLGDLRSAFHADIGIYHHSVGTYRGRKGELQVPQSLQGVITGVIGFDTRPKHRRALKKRRANAGPGVANGVPASEFAKRYNFPETHNGTSLDGTGQTVAIIELGGGYRTSDLQIYFQEIGLAKPIVSAVSVDHAGNLPTTPRSPDGEVMLDIEVVGAVAPGAKIVVYFAPNNGNQGFVDAISAAVHDTERRPSVLSISWGLPEDFISTVDAQTFHELFVEAAALGITVCAASGDHGTADMDSRNWDGKIHVDHPASDPLVLGCGGTQIDAGRDIAWNDETPFDPQTPNGGGWATGGGISVLFEVPDYQKNANKTNSLVTGEPGRGVPDIAMSATGYFVRVDKTEGQSGGTSAVAPLAAGLVCRLNQALPKPIGFINPFLYGNVGKGVTSDVTVGNNAIKNTVQGYDATVGWDACTGLGTLDGKAILENS